MGKECSEFRRHHWGRDVCINCFRPAEVHVRSNPVGAEQSAVSSELSATIGTCMYKSRSTGAVKHSLSRGPGNNAVAESARGKGGANRDVRRSEGASHSLPLLVNSIKTDRSDIQDQAVHNSRCGMEASLFVGNAQLVRIPLGKAGDLHGGADTVTSAAAAGQRAEQMEAVSRESGICDNSEKEKHSSLVPETGESCVESEAGKRRKAFLRVDFKGERPETDGSDASIPKDCSPVANWRFVDNRSDLCKETAMARTSGPSSLTSASNDEMVERRHKVAGHDGRWKHSEQPFMVPSAAMTNANTCPNGVCLAGTRMKTPVDLPTKVALKDNRNGIIETTELDEGAWISSSTVPQSPLHLLSHHSLPRNHLTLKIPDRGSLYNTETILYNLKCSKLQSSSVILGKSNALSHEWDEESKGTSVQDNPYSKKRHVSFDNLPLAVATWKESYSSRQGKMLDKDQNCHYLAKSNLETSETQCHALGECQSPKPELNSSWQDLQRKFLHFLMSLKNKASFGGRRALLNVQQGEEASPWRWASDPGLRSPSSQSVRKAQLYSCGLYNSWSSHDSPTSVSPMYQWISWPLQRISAKYGDLSKSRSLSSFPLSMDNTKSCCSAVENAASRTSCDSDYKVTTGSSQQHLLHAADGCLSLSSGITQATVTGLQHVCKLLQAPRSNELAAKDWEQLATDWEKLEVFALDQGGLHGACSMHVESFGQQRRLIMSIQLSTFSLTEQTGNPQRKVFLRDCALRRLLPTHPNILLSLAEFSHKLPIDIEYQLDIACADDQPRSCYVTECLADYVSASAFVYWHRNVNVTDPMQYEHEVALLAVQLLSALEHLQAQGAVYGTLDLSDVLVGPHPHLRGNRLLLTSFGYSLSPLYDLPASYKHDKQSLVYPRFVLPLLGPCTDQLPPELDQVSESSPIVDLSAVDAFSCGQFLASMLSVNWHELNQMAVYTNRLHEIAVALLCSSPKHRLDLNTARRVLEMWLWVHWTQAVRIEDASDDLLCTWLEVRRTELLADVAVKGATGELSIEDCLQCKFFATVTLAELKAYQSLLVSYCRG